VLSDIHLGYEHSDKASFNRFLDSIQRDAKGTTDLVLLGDIVDMWRRDSSGVFLENWDTLKKIMILQDKMRVHYVAGNHDFHVLRLQNHSYPFNFVQNLSLVDEDYRYTFVHGYEFDPLQDKVMMEALCRVMSDEVGNFESGVWASLTRDWSDITYIFSTLLLRKRKTRMVAEKIQINPEVRLEETVQSIEKRVCSTVRHGEVLVFGHTHRPFINKSENVANCGSWVTDATVHNTFVELSGGKPKLLVFEGEEIKERIEC
jgi:UDP-2,3-diacylglucosamine pyrophosphatase LpxH